MYAPVRARARANYDLNHQESFKINYMKTTKELHLSLGLILHQIFHMDQLLMWFLTSFHLSSCSRWQFLHTGIWIFFLNVHLPPQISTSFSNIRLWRNFMRTGMMWQIIFMRTFNCKDVKPLFPIAKIIKISKMWPRNLQFVEPPQFDLSNEQLTSRAGVIWARAHITGW